MKIDYSSEDDRLVVWFTSDGETGLRRGIPEGAAFLYDEKGKIAGIEIERAGERMDLSRMRGTGDKRRKTALRKQSGSGEVVVFTDGACLGNPGPGGWAVRLKLPDGRIQERGGSEPDTTNNRMELTAAIEGLKAAGDAPSVTLVTDSQYLRRGITGWIRTWKRNGWRTASKKPVLNQDLWKELDRLNSDRVTWKYTPGHAGDPDNERCDRIAQAFARGERPELIGGETS